MATDSLIGRLTNAKRCGVYHLSRNPGDLARAARAGGMSVHCVNLGGATGKADLLSRFAGPLRFPAHFGRNFDALRDCLTDLSWLGGAGRIVVVEDSKEFAIHYREDVEAAVEVLRRACEFWRSEGQPFWVFFTGPRDRKIRLREFR